MAKKVNPDVNDTTNKGCYSFEDYTKATQKAIIKKYQSMFGQSFISTHRADVELWFTENNPAIHDRCLFNNDVKRMVAFVVDRSPLPF